MNKTTTKILNENKLYFDHWAGTYDRSIFHQFWTRGFYRPIVKEINKLKGRKKILDVSCGTGNFLSELFSHELYGLDFSPNMVSIAARKLEGKANIQQGDVHTLPFPDNHFDYALSTEAFHHYYDQQKALHELVRVTKSGGKIIISDIHFFLRPIHWLFKQLEPGCVRINSRKSIQTLFKNSGIKNITQHRRFLFSIQTTGVKS